MFSSSSSGILLSQVSPCFNHTTASFLGLNDKETSLLHSHDLLSHYFSVSPVRESASKIMVSTKGTSANTEIYRHNEVHSPPFHSHRRKIAIRKDRHSKICTAQGPRARRVRLSMDIARKFFDLQDLLGFDKASKTLDWLLTKSRTAIKELVQMKHVDDASSRSLCSSSECEVVTEMNEDAENGDFKRRRKRVHSPVKHTGAKVPPIAKFDNLAKELRTKARARARERTIEKNCIRQVCDTEKLSGLSPFSTNQLRPWCQIGACMTNLQSDSQHRISSLNFNTGVDEVFCLCPRRGEAETEEVFQKSLMIASTSIFGIQQNLLLKEASANFCHWSPNTTENWENSSTITCSSLCAICNMSSSKVLQIRGMPLESNNNSNED